MPTPNEYDTIAYGNPDLMAQEEALADRKARLKQRALDAAKGIGLYATPDGPIPGQNFTSAVTGATMLGPTTRRPLLSSLTPLIAETRDAYDQGKLDEDRSGYQRMEAEAAQRHMQAMPQPRVETYAGPNGPAQRTVEPTEQEKLQWAQRGAQIPSLRPTMQQYIADQVIKAPERQEAREERKLTREETRAEAQRKQAEELQYRRERDAQTEQLRRDLAGESNDLRRTLHAAIASNGAASGDGKASDYQIIQGDNGEVYRVGKKPGSPVERVDAATGKSSGQQQKDALETRGQVERSTSAINNAGGVEKLLGSVSASGLKSDIRSAMGYAGYSDAATQAEKQLKPLADLYLKSVPRFEGPQSDKDTASYKEAAADLANPRIAPEDRKAALQTVVRLHKQALAQAAARGNQPTSPRVPSPATAPTKAPASSVSDDDLVRMYSK